MQKGRLRDGLFVRDEGQVTRTSGHHTNLVTRHCISRRRRASRQGQSIAARLFTATASGVAGETPAHPVPAAKNTLAASKTSWNRARPCHSSLVPNPIVMPAKAGVQAGVILTQRFFAATKPRHSSLYFPAKAGIQAGTKRSCTAVHCNRIRGCRRDAGVAGTCGRKHPGGIEEPMEQGRPSSDVP